MRSRLFSIIGLVAGSMLAVSAANATLVTIGLQQAGVHSGNIWTVSSGNDAASYFGTYGTFTSNISTMISSVPNLLTNSMNVSSANSAGTLTVYVTESGIDFPGYGGAAYIQFLSSFTSNVLPDGWSVTEATYVDPGNGLFALTTLLGSQTFTAIGTSVQGKPLGIDDAPYSLTQVYTITAVASTAPHNSANSTIDLFATVAEPASLLLLGAGLVGIGWTARRRRKA